ncbi:hypothetical protein Purlil1_8320 [Purpureocillium lilacinum]|uniref:Uncharacterized protein n=1 Tax=Purpureocillium lilacinum TaxID=33203 RepID=A0ABR0BTA5_PURLI|nr:hypothetical protein Purlil1_8320 [Purpureocillium lilacinum]
MALTPNAPAESAGTRSHLWTSGPQGSSHYSLVLERLAIEMLGPDRCMASGLVRGWRSAKGKTLVLVWRAVQSVLPGSIVGVPFAWKPTPRRPSVAHCLRCGYLVAFPAVGAVPNDCTTTPYYLRSRDGRGGVQVPVLPANSRSRSPGQMVLGPASKPSRAPHTVPVGVGVGVRVVDGTGAWTWTWAWAVGTSRPTFNSRLPAPAKQGLAFIQRGIGGRGHVQHRHPPSAAKTPSDPNAAKRLPSREHDKGPVALDSVVPLPGDLVRLGRCRVPKLLIAEPARLSC